MNQFQNMAYGVGPQAFVPQSAQSPNPAENAPAWLDLSKLHNRYDGLGLHRPGYVLETPEQAARMFERLFPDTDTLQPAAAVPGEEAQLFHTHQSHALQLLEGQVQLLQAAIVRQGAQLAALAVHIASSGLNRV